MRKDDLGYIAPIRTLWAPLLRSLSRARQRRYQQWQQGLTKSSEDRHLVMRLRQKLGIGSWEPPGPVQLPDSYRFASPRPRLCACQRCGREFYRLSENGRYCSDACAEGSWHDSRAIHNSAMVKGRSAARAAARADRRCARCNEPMAAQRSTSKFCSVRCRRPRIANASRRRRSDAI